MKQFIMVSALAMVMATVNAQNDITSLKQNEKALKQQRAILEKEKKETRKEVRKLEGKEVSVFTKDEFRKDFGDIAVSRWERTAAFDKAWFVKEGHELTAYYDHHSKLVGTTEEKTFADLPALAQKTIDTKYKDYTTEKVIWFDDNEVNEADMILFNNPFEDEDCYFIVLKKDSNEIILQSDMNGEVRFFKQM